MSQANGQFSKLAGIMPHNQQPMSESHSVKKSGKMITVAHFMPWSGIGGVEIATLRLTEATCEQFHHVAFCLHDAVALRNSFEKLGVETIPYFAPTPSLRHVGKFYKESMAVAKQLRQVGAHIVHFSDQKAAHHNSLAAFLAHCRTVCHLRVSYTHLNLRDRLCLLPVQSFIFVSKEAEQSFAISLPVDKSRVIYDAVEIPDKDMTESTAIIRRKHNIPVGYPVVGMVARVSAQKDYSTLASAAAKVLMRHPDTLFLIVGDNALVDLNREHYQDVVRKLKELNIAERFIFTGHQNDVFPFIAVMDFCVLCTHREGFPLSILESMAMRKPVIATAVGGIPEIIEPDVTGYLHSHENSKELAGAIISLIEDPAKTSRMGLAAREHVRKKHSRQTFANEISKAYSDVMQH